MHALLRTGSENILKYEVMVKLIKSVPTEYWMSTE